MSTRTEHGFRSGAIEVSALVETARGSVVGIEVGRHRLGVQSSPKGQKVVVRLIGEPDDVPNLDIETEPETIVRIGVWAPPSSPLRTFASIFRDGNYVGGVEK